MINLGYHKGKGLPNVNIPATPVDLVLMGVSILVTMVIWILLLVYHQEVFQSDKEYLFAAVAGTVITIISVVASRIPVRWVNFPVRVNEQNVGRQFFLAFRMVRVVMVEVNLIFLFISLSYLNPTLMVYKELFNIIVVSLLAITILIYLMLANKWK